jgi:hypothetical protein
MPSSLKPQTRLVVMSQKYGLRYCFLGVSPGFQLEPHRDFPVPYGFRTLVLPKATGAIFGCIAAPLGPIAIVGYRIEAILNNSNTDSVII